MDRPGRWFEAIGLAVGLTALLVVTAGAASLPTEQPTRLFELHPVRVREVAVSALQVAYLVVLAVAFYHWLSRLPGDGSRRRRGLSSPELTLVALLLAFGALFFLGSLGDDNLLNQLFPAGDGESAPAEESGGDEAGGAELGPGTGAAAEGPAPWEAIWTDPWLAVAALVALGGVALVVLRRRHLPEEAGPDSPHPSAPGPRPEPAAHLAPSDPRGRVFAAVARVEALSARRGRARPASATVGSHLRRLARDSGAALGALYDRARFSSHPVEEAMAAAAEETATRIEEEMG